MDEHDQPMVPIYLNILKRRGLKLPPSARVLDFGAGLGRHVREFESKGLECWGVDIQTERVVKAVAEAEQDTSHIRLYAPWHREPVPFETDSFDLIVSTSTFEHVMDYEWALAEIARMLRTDGVSIHIFPARWRPIESHLHMPFGARFHPYWYCWVFARVGPRRHPFYRDLSTTGAAKGYSEFFRTGANYPTASQLRRLCRPYFAQVEWAERDFIASSTGISRVSRKIIRWTGLPGVCGLYRGFHTRVLLLRRPVRP